MRTPDSNCKWPRLLMFSLGLLLVGSAQAFTPLSGPISATAMAPPNVVLVLDNSSSMVMNRVGDETRLELARRTAREVMAEHRHLRFGLFAFRATQGRGDADRDAPGGELLVPVESITAESAAGQQHLARLQAAMDALAPQAGDDREAWTWTPLAETYYEVTRYLRGMRAFYPQSKSELEREQFVSPIEYRCQRTTGLVLTDGLPTYDREFPGSLAQDPDGRRPDSASGFHLPDWDQDASNDLDGGEPMAEGSSFYLDDMAAFARQIDLRPSGRGALADSAGQSWDDADFAHQQLQTHVLGFSLDDPRLRAAARAGGGRYFSVEDGDGLRSAMASALAEVSSAPGSGGGAVVAGAMLKGGSTRYYQTAYDPADWSGTLRALLLDAQGVPTRQLWSTEQTLRPGPVAGRQQSWRWGDGQQPAAPVALSDTTYLKLSVNQQTALDEAAYTAGLDAADAGQQLLDWARGKRVAGLRQRRQLLGDVINTTPALFSAVAPLPLADDAGYQQHLARRRALPEMVVLGANDGFVRIFDATGQQRYAYLPATLQPRLGEWARPDYAQGQPHLSGIDGQLGLADMQLDDGWATLAAGGLGGGGKALFALQLLAPGATTAEPQLLWETNAQQRGWQDLGHLYAAPQLVRAANRPLLLTGNGYGSASGRAALLVVDALNGELLRSIAVPGRPGQSEPNGLAGLALQRNENGKLMAAFAGDQHGQMWKFDLDGDDHSAWKVAHAGSPLFSAAADQPISVTPVLHPSAPGLGDLLLFGTGQFLQPQDLLSTATQAFYAVLDTATPPSGGLTRAHLQQQSILSSNSQQDASPATRQASAEPVDWQRQYGWWLALPERGERVTRAASIKDSRVLFGTGLLLGEGEDPCVSRAGGWLMSLSLDSGGMLPMATMDSNDDGRVDDADQAAAGIRLDIGLPGDLIALDLPARPDSEQQTDCNPELYLVQGSDGVGVVQGQAHCRFERILWRQLQ
ncbi:MAG: PilC/PilY family type IV pilus protein [Halopseudomonas sp.]|uniref:PilC/PilY family type IV pilus protein n=1 Tax=Halopseudomonas sp. TaxID=2901191 RepID=UPI003001F225